MLFDVGDTLYIERMDEKTVTFEAFPGSHVVIAVREGIRLSKMISKQAIVRFNGVDIYVKQGMEEVQALDAYDAGLNYNKLNSQGKKRNHGRE